MSEYTVGRVTDEVLNLACAAYNKAMRDAGYDDSQDDGLSYASPMALRAALAAQGQVQGEAVAEVIRNEAGQVYLKWAAKKSITDFTGAKFYTHPAPPASPAGVPDGWVLVPREPTPAMIVAFWEPDMELGRGGYMRPVEIYKAMLAAAPSAPEGDGGAE